MGVHENVGIDRFPKQGAGVGKRVLVGFNYDTSKWVEGTIVRDDVEAPFETIILLGDGRLVRACECQHTLPNRE